MTDPAQTLLITGSGARFASHLARDLVEHGWSVRTVLQGDPTSTSPASHQHVEQPDSDASALLEALHGVGVVILLGGIGPVNSVVADVTALDTILGNLQPGSTLISVTSLAVFGDSGAAPVTEDDEPPTPDEFATARACEQRVLAANDWLRGAVLRPGLVYGSDGGGAVIRDAIDLARTHGEAHFFGEPHDVIPTVHEDDLLDLVHRVLKDESAAGIYHAVSGAVSAQGLSGLIGATAGVDLISPWDESTMIEAFGEVITMPRISVNADLARSRSVRELGWSPAGAPLRDCMSLVD